jgi:phosphoribosylanthranilate isomerase
MAVCIFLYRCRFGEDMSGSKTKIKICGISREEDIAAVNRYRPDFIGFVFAESKRKVTVSQAARLAGILDKAVITVGVFVDSPPDGIVDIARQGIISMVQLHGNEADDEIIYIHRKTGLKVIRSVTVRTAKDIVKAAQSPADMLLLDNGKGTGNTFNWHIFKDYMDGMVDTNMETSDIKEERQVLIGGKPFMVAGGIDLSNIKEALQIPAYAVDLSGGAETDGVKDPEKIRKLVEAVRLYGR